MNLTRERTRHMNGQILRAMTNVLKSYAIGSAGEPADSTLREQIAQEMFEQAMIAMEEQAERDLAAAMGPARPSTHHADFRKEIEHVINKHSREAGSDTPDFILANFLCQSLDAFDYATRERNRWYGQGEAAVGGAAH